MAAVKIVASAFTDFRYDILAKLAGWSNRHEALGRMALVWNACQERGTYTSPRILVAAILEHDQAPDYLVQAELAKCEWESRKKVEEHSIRICGTRGRIEWLKNKRVTARQNGKLGGRPRKPKSNQDRLRPETTSASASASASESEEDTPIPPHAPRARHADDLPGFEAAWHDYPHVPGRSKKEPSRKLWIKRKLEPHAERVLMWIRYMRTTTDWRREGGAYVQGMERWLKGIDFTEDPADMDPNCEYCHSDPKVKGTRWCEFHQTEISR